MVSVNMRTSAEYDVRIDRTTQWGNPFVVGKHGSRDEVVAYYKQWLWARIKDGTVSTELLATLDGKRLGCWCAPQACHGDVLTAAAAWAARNEAIIASTF